jgi:hypothetical protein
LAKANSARDIVNFVRENGRMIYTEEVMRADAHMTVPYQNQFEVVPAPEIDGLDAIAGTAPF